MHGGEHWTSFYTDYGVELQKKFFGHFLQGRDTGWQRQPRIQLQVRRPGENFALRYEDEWPIARTNWTRLYLSPSDRSLSERVQGQTSKVTFQATGAGVTFGTGLLEREVEITGPAMSKLFVSSSTEDADLFLVLRVFDPDRKEVTFAGALDPRTPIAQGWLRASHRKLDKKLSTEHRPYHTHDELWPLKPNEIVELDIEIWPTCIVIPKGYSLAVTILGRDYEHEGDAARLSNMKNPMKGCGPFVHDDETDRRPSLPATQPCISAAPISPTCFFRSSRLREADLLPTLAASRHWCPFFRVKPAATITRSFDARIVNPSTSQEAV